MGIKDLNFLIKRYNRYRRKNQHSIREISLYDLKGKRLAIDLQLYLYRALIQEKNPVEEIFKQILHLERYKITPIYVFDGKPPKEKMEEIYKRVIRRNRSIEVIKYLENVYLSKVEDNNREQVIKKITELKRNSITIDLETKQNVRYLCDVMGVEYRDEKNMEADKVIGMMYRDGEIDGVISEDNDMLVYGCNYLYRFYKSNSSHIIEYNLEGIKANLGLNDEQFLDLCILCGCDYYKNIKFKTDGVKNSVVAYYLIQKYGNVDEVSKKGYLPDDLDYKRIRNIYKMID